MVVGLVGWWCYIKFRPWQVGAVLVNHDVDVVDHGGILRSSDSGGAPAARSSSFPVLPPCPPFSGLGCGRWVAIEWQRAMGER